MQKKKNLDTLEDRKENLYGNRVKQKMFARVLGGGIVSLLVGIFTMNFLLILLGIILVGISIKMR